MLWTAIVVFSVAVLLGIVLLSYILTDRPTPKGLVFIHGPVAALGIILLLIYAIFFQPNIYLSLIIFIIAALGGFLMIYRDLTGRSVPKWLALGHGLIAITGLVILIITVLTLSK